MKRALTEASLIMKPEGYAEGVLPSLKPSNGDGDFTFTRGSNLSATRVNAEGLIEKGRENLLLQSNQFDTTWAGNNALAISEYADRNGGTNAWLLREQGGNIQHYIRQSSGLYSGIGTFSFYAKKKDYDWIQFARSGDGGDYANFNISNGTLGNVSGASIIDRKIESVGNGWYRCSVTYSFNSNSFVGIALIRSDVSTRYEVYQGDNTSGTYIQDSQVESGLVATDYIETRATTAKAGVLENTPRLDYSGGATKPSLLLEPQRTNLIENSEYITSANNASISYNATESPEGLLNALIFTATSGDPFVRSANFSITTGISYSISFYIKGFGTAVGKLSSSSVTNTAVHSFTLTDSWQRITYTGTATDTRTNAQLRIDAPNTGGIAGEQVSVWGLQVEQGATTPTSYIPTYGTIATRGNDNCSIASTNMFGASKGAFFIEGYVNTLDSGGIIPFTAGIATSALIYVWIQTTGALYIEWYESGSLQAQLNAPSGTINVGDSFKISAAYQDNDFVAYLNGTQIESDTSGTAPNPTGLKIGRYTSGAYTGGALDKVILFKERLSNAELAALTKLD